MLVLAQQVAKLRSALLDLSFVHLFCDAPGLRFGRMGGATDCRGLALSTTNHTSAEAAEGTAMKNRPRRDSAARSFAVRCGVGSFSMSGAVAPGRRE
jgi:hypothetical protein